MHSTGSVLVPFARPVRRARLVRRRQRFLVDVILEDGPDAGQAVTAHTANTGAMTGLLEDEAPVLLTDHEGSKRQLRYEVEAICVSRDWVSVNTLAANAFAQRALELGLVAELTGYASIRREVAPSKRSRSRFDLLLERTDGRCCFVEVKSVTLKHHGHALFPDAVTERGRKHLDALRRLATKGERAAMLYVNKRTGCDVFRAASAIDALYASALRRAAKAGVEIICVGCTVDERGLSFGGRLPVELS